MVQKVSLARIVDSPFCVSIEDGQKVYDLIVTALQRREQVQVSFAGVERLTTAFLNAAIGQLYDNFSDDEIRRFLLPVEGASQEQLRLLVRVVDNAKKFFANPSRLRGIISGTLGES
jgi:hypothetical protein